MFDIAWYIILAAFILDFFLGDPAVLPHPVVYMGKSVDFFEPLFRKYDKNLFLSGLFFALFLIFSSWIISFAAIKLCTNIHPIFGKAMEILLLFFCFSCKSLDNEALKVFYSLKQNNLKKARTDLSRIVGRQTHYLDETSVVRADIETVAENFVDGFLSPLFFAAVGGVPMAIAYKMINTLDSMVGYKNERYILFGRASARIDDAANFIPARISVMIIGLSIFLFSIKRGILSFKTGFSQGLLHTSPNAGYPEAAFAGALKIKLGGPSMYHGKVVEKPYIGNRFPDPDKYKIKQACDIMMLASFLSTLIVCLILIAV